MINDTAIRFQANQRNNSLPSCHVVVNGVGNVELADNANFRLALFHREGDTASLVRQIMNWCLINRYHCTSIDDRGNLRTHSLSTVTLGAI